MDKAFKYFPAVLFCLYFTKLLILGAGLSDAPVLAITAALLLALEYKIKNKQIEELKSEISKLSAALDEQKKDIEQMKSVIGAVKLGNIRNTFQSGR